VIDAYRIESSPEQQGPALHDPDRLPIAMLIAGAGALLIAARFDGLPPTQRWRAAVGGTTRIHLRPSLDAARERALSQQIG